MVLGMGLRELTNIHTPQVDYTNGYFSVLNVEGEIFWGSTSDIYNVGTPNNTPYPLIAFNTTGTSGTQMHFIEVGQFTGYTNST